MDCSYFMQGAQCEKGKTCPYRHSVEARSNAVAKNAADDKLRQSMRGFASTYPPPATVVLVSGEVNFSPELSDLRHTHNFTILLVHSRVASKALKVFAHKCFDCDAFSEDVDAPREQQRSNPGPCGVQPAHTSPAQQDILSSGPALGQLLSEGSFSQSPFGNGTGALQDSRVGHEVKPTADDGIGQSYWVQKRVTGEDVFGCKIACTLEQPPHQQPPTINAHTSSPHTGNLHTINPHGSNPPPTTPTPSTPTNNPHTSNPHTRNTHSSNRRLLSGRPETALWSQFLQNLPSRHPASLSVQPPSAHQNQPFSSISPPPPPQPQPRPLPRRSTATHGSASSPTYGTLPLPTILLPVLASTPPLPPSCGSSPAHRSSASPPIPTTPPAPLTPAPKHPSRPHG